MREGIEVHTEEQRSSCFDVSVVTQPLCFFVLVDGCFDKATNLQQLSHWVLLFWP